MRRAPPPTVQEMLDDVEHIVASWTPEFRASIEAWRKTLAALAEPTKEHSVLSDSDEEECR